MRRISEEITRKEMIDPQLEGSLGVAVIQSYMVVAD